MAKWPKKGTDEYRAFMREYMKVYSERKRQDPVYLEEQRRYHREYKRKWSSDPDNRQRQGEQQRAGWHRRMQDPAFREKTRVRRTASYHRRKQDPVWVTRQVRQQVCRERGITVADYEQRLKDQNGVCAICGQPETDRRRKYLSIDHCHEGGHVRGLLCRACNQALGFMKDSPEQLRKAADYLEARITS